MTHCCEQCKSYRTAIETLLSHLADQQSPSDVHQISSSVALLEQSAHLACKCDPEDGIAYEVVMGDMGRN